MGDSAFYWQSSLSPIAEVDLGRKASALVDVPVRREAVSTSVSGSRTKVIHYGATRWRIQLDTITDLALVRKLQTMCNYLQNGGVVAFATDTDKIFGGFVSHLPTHGQTTIRIAEDMFSEFNAGGGGLSSGDAVVLQSPTPSYKVDEVLLSSQSGKVLSLSEGTRYDWSLERWVFVRHAGFLPFLRLVEGGTNAPHLSNDRRVAWTLDLELEEVAPALETASNTPNNAISKVTDPELGGSFDYGGLSNGHIDDYSHLFLGGSGSGVSQLVNGAGSGSGTFGGFP